MKPRPPPSSKFEPITEKEREIEIYDKLTCMTLDQLTYNGLELESFLREREIVNFGLGGDSSARQTHTNKSYCVYVEILFSLTTNYFL